MRPLLAVTSLLLIAMILLDGFETMLLPRRVARGVRLTRFFFIWTWAPYRWLATRLPTPKRTATFLSLFGPSSMLLLFAFWASSLILGFALLQFALEIPLSVASSQHEFVAYLYLSGVTFFTLGYGDITPAGPVGRLLAVTEAGVGFGFLAVVISYIPVLYQAFSGREPTISLLDARAGSPPTACELYARLGAGERLEALGGLLAEWERWAAELLESHLSFPVLVYYRSQHDNQSWLASLTLMLDVSALALTEIRGVDRYQARLTFAMARHAVVDLAQVFTTKPHEDETHRVTAEILDRLRDRLKAHGVTFHDDDPGGLRLAELRKLYEPFVIALGRYCVLEIPPILAEPPAVDNWQTSAWMRHARGLDRLGPGLDPDDQLDEALAMARTFASPTVESLHNFVVRDRPPRLEPPAPTVDAPIFRTMDAIRCALEIELTTDDRVFVAGIDVAEGGNVFGLMRGLHDQFGSRVRDTPISETAIMGVGVGAAMAGMHPVVELMYLDFLGVCLDQLMNQAAKMTFMTGGAAQMGLTVRTQFGAGRSSGSQHSQSLEAILAHIPGLSVVMPSTPADTYGLLRAAIQDPNPVIFIENRLLYGMKGPQPPAEHIVPIGKSAVVRAGTDITVVSVSRMVHEVLAAADTVGNEGISVEVIDLRTVAPLDLAPVLASVAKTSRLMIAHEAAIPFGIGAEIAARVGNECFWSLDAPIMRVGAQATPPPYAPNLEQAWLPNHDTIAESLRHLASI